MLADGADEASEVVQAHGIPAGSSTRELAAAASSRATGADSEWPGLRAGSSAADRALAAVSPDSGEPATAAVPPGAEAGADLDPISAQVTS